MAAQTTPLAALAIKFGGGFPTGMLLIDGGSDNAFVALRHQVWRWAPCGDAAGRWRHR